MVNDLDHTLMLWLNYDGGTILDAFWYAVSYKFSWVPLYVAILVVLVQVARRYPLTPAKSESATPANSESATPAKGAGFFSRHQHLLVLILITVLIIVAADQLSSGLIKPLVQRLRPSHQPGLMEQLHYVGDYRGGKYGFVSSHAANTMALAVWVSLLFRHRGLWCAMATFCLVNCYSRIYLGVHYPGDILCGSLIGVLCAWLGYTAYRKAVSRLALPAPNISVSTAPITLTCWASLLIMLLYALLY